MHSLVCGYSAGEIPAIFLVVLIITIYYIMLHQITKGEKQMKSQVKVKSKSVNKTVKSLLDMPEDLNRRVKIEAAKRGLTITDTVLAVLNENID